MKNTNNIIFEKLGRNIYFLQRIEVMLKFLISRADVSFDEKDIGNLLENCDTWKKSKDTLGAVYSKYFSSLYSAASDEENENTYHYRFKVESNTDSRKDEIEKIIKLRNELIHLFPIKYVLNEENVKLDAIEYLDECFKLIKYEFNKIKNEIESMIAMAKSLEVYLLKSKSQISNKDIIIKQLIEIQNQIFDKDGWTNVSDAGRLISEFNGKNSEILNEYKSIGLKNYIVNINAFILKNDDNNWKYKVST